MAWNLNDQMVRLQCASLTASIFILCLSHSLEHIEREVFRINRLESLMSPVIAANVAQEYLEAFLLSKEVSDGWILPQLVVPQKRPEELFKLCLTLLNDLLA